MRSIQMARDIVYLKEQQLDEIFTPRSTAARVISRIKGTGTEVKRNLQKKVGDYKDWVEKKRLEADREKKLNRHADKPSEKTYDDYSMSILRNSMHELKRKEPSNFSKQVTIARLNNSFYNGGDGGSKVKK